MTTISRLKLLAWKEVLDTIRDTRTLALMALSAMILPVLGLLIAGLQSQQQVRVLVKVCDESSEAWRVARLLSSYLASNRIIVNTTGCRSQISMTTYDASLVIPRGFGANVSSIDKPVIVYVRELVGSTSAMRARMLIEDFFFRLSEKIAVRRIKELAVTAGVNVSANTILHPLRIVEVKVTATGKPAPRGLALRVEAARFLAFAVFFVLNPAIMSIADTFAGERERRTAEMLASSPLTPVELILGKLAGGLVVALIASALDATGVLAYMGLGGLSVSGLGVDLALFHALATLVAVMVSAGLTAPIAVAAPTPRSATIGASLVSGVATAVFFSILFIDVSRLPTIIQYVLYAIPYTHIAVSILNYALGYRLESILHILVAIVFGAVGVVAAAKIYSPERFVRT